MKLTRPIRFHDDKNRWMAPSESDPLNPYLVDMDDEEVGFFCGCNDWNFRQKEHGPKYLCKHVRMVLKEMARLEKKGSKTE